MAEADTRAREGQTLAGKYLLETLLGEGGMGAVYRATNQLIGRTVAIKVLHAEFASKPDVVARFLQEARAANLVRHVNVVDVLDIGQDATGAPFIVQEFLHGEDLAHALAAVGGKLSLPSVLEIMLPVIDAMALAHSRGVVHRDLKPENVFLAVPEGGGAPVAKLLDFGISQVTSAPKDARLTQPGTAMGTPAYMSPEQVLAKREIDARTDVWSLGVILYECISGTMPFQADNPSAYMVTVATADPRPLVAAVPDVVPEVARVVMRCLRRDPDHRYPTAAELARDLRLSIAGAQPETTGQRAAVKLPDAVLERGSHPQLVAMARASNPDWSPPDAAASTGGPAPLTLPDMVAPRPLSLPEIGTAKTMHAAPPAPAFAEPKPLSLPDIVVKPAPVLGPPRQMVPHVAPDSQARGPQLDLPADELAAIAPRPLQQGPPPVPAAPGADVLDIRAPKVDLDLELRAATEAMGGEAARAPRPRPARVAARPRPTRPKYDLRAVASYGGVIGIVALAVMQGGRLFDVPEAMNAAAGTWAEWSFWWLRAFFAGLWLLAAIVTGYYASIFKPRHHGLALATVGALGVVAFEGMATFVLLPFDGGDRALGVARWALVAFAAFPIGLGVHQAVRGWGDFAYESNGRAAGVRAVLAAILLAFGVEAATMREEPQRALREPTVREHLKRPHGRPPLPRHAKDEPAAK